MKKITALMIGVTMIFSLFGLFGCSNVKYSVSADPDFTMKKSSFREGEKVTLYYDFIATDTDYHFYTDTDDVKLTVTHTDSHAFVVTFKMPAHDVKVSVDAKNTMYMTRRYYSVSVTNNLPDADIWILPDREENRKTTVWGTPTLENVVSGTATMAEVETEYENDLFIFRIIDKNGMFYSCDEVDLSEAASVLLKEGEEPMTTVLELYDGNGELISEHEVFVGRL